MKDNMPHWTGFLVGIFFSLFVFVMMGWTPGQTKSKFEKEAVEAGVARYVLTSNIPPTIQFQFITNNVTKS